MWVDTHCHLDAGEFGGQSVSVAGDAAAAGVRVIVIPAIARRNFDTVAQLARQAGNAVYALGIHPLFVPTSDPADLVALRAAIIAALDDPLFIGLGEIGLDFFVPALKQAPLREKQEWFFAEQLKLAREFGLPVLMHVRRSQDIILKHLRRIKVPGGTAHAFNGSFQQAETFIELGFHLGFGGAMTFPRSLQIRRLAAELPLSAIVLETDAPDISPAWRHPAINTPDQVPRIGEVLAGLRGITPDQVAQATSANARAALPRLASSGLGGVMRSVIIGFALGVGLLQMQARLPGLEWYAVGLVLAALLGASAWKFWKPLLRVPLLLTCGAWLGFLWAAAFAQYYLDQELPSAWEGHDVVVIGTVADLPDRTAQGWRFRFDVEQVELQNGRMPPVPPRISLAWYGNRRLQAPVEDGEGAAPERQQLADLPPGSRWRLKVRLKRPHGNANPGGFDYEVWLLQDDVRATGYVVGPASPAGSGPGAANRMLDAFVWTPSHVIEQARGWLRDRILAALPGAPYAPVVAALVMGDQRGISQADWSVFNRTGISHLMAISGLHITMLAAMWGGLVGWLWRRSFFTRAHLPLRVPAQKVAVLAGLGMALFYVMLSGFGVPAQRTLYMLAVVGLAFWSGRFTRASLVLCLALGLVLVLDPWSVLWPGFWLSFGAVAILLYGTLGRMQPAYAMQAAAARRWWQKLWLGCRAAASAQWVVTLGLAPLTVLLFGQISLVSPIANALAIPLVGFLITPLSLLGSVLPPPLAGWVLQVAQQLLAWLAECLQWLDAMPWAVWQAPLPSWWMFLAALGGTVLMLAPRGWPARWLGVFGWLPVLLNTATVPAEGSMRVTAFDVGQGMALLVETPGHRLLYDTGPVYSWQSDGATRVILPYLRARGIEHLDRVVISHSDNDHSGGALSLFKGVRVDSVLSSLPATHPVVRAAPNAQRCEAGQSWNWDGIGFTMLHPTAATYDSDKWKPNARSCVLKVQIGRQSILLTGDIEALQEEHLLGGSMAEQLPSTVLLAPHHGSSTSSTEPFLRAVHPELAIFQVGYRNRFNHPRPEVDARYARLGIRRLRTDQSGAVTMDFGDRLETEQYRLTHQRYWHDR